MTNKELFGIWLSNFHKNPHGTKFKSKTSYFGYIHGIAKDLNIDEDEIYKIKNVKKIKSLEEKLNKSKSFNARSLHQKQNFISAIHLYENLLEILSNKKLIKIN